MTIELLTEHSLEFLSLKGGCAGSSESTLVKMPHCWKSHVAAQIYHHTSLLKHYSNGIKYDNVNKQVYKDPKYRLLCVVSIGGNLAEYSLHEIDIFPNSVTINRNVRAIWYKTSSTDICICAE